jgi:urease accessory protein
MRSVTDVFKSLPVATAVTPADALPAAAAGFATDDIVLDWEQRLKPRARRVSSGGVEFATALPRGTVLRQGDCLVLASAQLVIHVVECPEQVLVIRPADAVEAAEFAYHIGNSHSPLMLDGGLIICPELPGMSRLLDYHRIPFERAERPFTPIGPSAGHRHGVAS